MSMDELRLVKAVDGLGERIVVAVADAADGGAMSLGTTVKTSGELPRSPGSGIAVRPPHCHCPT